MKAKVMAPALTPARGATTLRTFAPRSRNVAETSRHPRTARIVRVLKAAAAIAAASRESPRATETASVRVMNDWTPRSATETYKAKPWTVMIREYPAFPQ